MTLEQHKLKFALMDVIVPADDSEALLYELLAEIANDNNSSKFREDITKIVVGLRPSEGKLGYDDDILALEVKPNNFTGRAKLDGRGNFSDLTWARHNKYLLDKLVMLVSGFHRGKLLYIVEFPYGSIAPRMQEYLEARLPSGDTPNIYVRSACFTYKHWSDKQYVVKYLRENISDYAHVFNKKFYNLLIPIP